MTVWPATPRRAINPFLSADEAEALLDVATAAVLHASRVGQVNRALSEAQGLYALLQPRGGAGFGGAEERAEAAAAIDIKAKTLADHLLTARHYVDRGSDGELSLEPRL